MTKEQKEANAKKREAEIRKLAKKIAINHDAVELVACLTMPICKDGKKRLSEIEHFSIDDIRPEEENENVLCTELITFLKRKKNIYRFILALKQEVKTIFSSENEYPTDSSIIIQYANLFTSKDFRDVKERNEGIVKMILFLNTQEDYAYASLVGGSSYTGEMHPYKLDKMYEFVKEFCRGDEDSEDAVYRRGIKKALKMI